MKREKIKNIVLVVLIMLIIGLAILIFAILKKEVREAKQDELHKWSTVTRYAIEESQDSE